MIQFDEHIFQMGWFNHYHQLDFLLPWMFLFIQALGTKSPCQRLSFDEGGASAYGETGAPGYFGSRLWRLTGGPPRNPGGDGGFNTSPLEKIEEIPGNEKKTAWAV